MALREEMERQGQWLFRWRSYVPVALLLVLAAGLIGFRYPNDDRKLQELWELLCVVISLAGIALRALVVGFTPEGTSGRNTGDGQVAESLNTTGLYMFVRHPLYLGNFLMWVGVAMMPRSLWLVVVVCLAFWLYYERIMLAEEAFLRNRFGATYDEWANRTPPFLPRLSALTHPTWVRPSLQFSVRNVLKREYSGVMAVALLCGLVDAMGAWIVVGNPVPGAFASTTMVVGAIVYFTLRTLKRNTRVLDVAGR